jgi:hypothetical protein
MYQSLPKLLSATFAVLLALFFTELTPTVSGQTLEVKENQLVILKMTTGPAKVIKAKQVEVKEQVIMTTDFEGKRSAWQKSMVAHMISLHDDQTEKLSDDKIEECLSLYAKVMAEYSESKDILDQETLKWRTVQEKGKKLASEVQEQGASALQQHTQAVFDQTKNYTIAELTAVIGPGLTLAQQRAELTEQLTEYLKPWQQRLQYLEEGRKLFEGQWLTKAEILKMKEERSLAEQQRFFTEEAKLNLTSLVLPQSTVIISLLVVVGTLLSVLFSFYGLATSRGGNLTFSGAITLLLGLAILGAYGFYGYKISNFTTELKDYWEGAYTTSVPEDQLPNPLPRLMFMASGSTLRNITPADAKVVLQDTQINVLIKKFLKITPPAQAQTLDLQRTEIAVRLLSDRIEFIDQVVCFDKKILIRYEIFYKSDAGSFSIYRQDVYLGGAHLPSALGSFMFRQFFRSFQDCVNATNIPQIYTIEKVEAGALALFWPVPVTATAAERKADALSTEAGKRPNMVSAEAKVDSIPPASSPSTEAAPNP